MSTVKYNNIKIEGLNVFYRESGNKDAPTLLLLHGFPSSSYQFRHLFSNSKLDKYHLVAPDYIGYGNSDQPSTKEFEYSFDNQARIIQKFIDAIGLKRFSIYVFDYGAPIGYRLATAQPERIEGIVIQNGNAYNEGIDCKFWDNIKKFWINPKDPEVIPGVLKLLTLEATKWQYQNGARDISSVSPDGWLMDQYFLDRPGNAEVQAAMLHSYSTNPPLYPQWQEYFRTHQPSSLLVWGKGDEIFPASGAYPYQKDLKNLEFHLLNTGHFALEEDSILISNLIDNFLYKIHNK
ncbi:hypothetical protein DLAC_09768 [Tieghemostelium lacteum]|uniref:AB hydrolase-1 domain-containing protein n=1 Tax=Tieghemostelium lacteum TaxID=361077 RepID=A0A151Z786_TIELA|nr:hypothetical protein DLAC_09768 [Tieghemostelium lacteum]|eukprot:KYQ89798.1 hypothetical protein DLAC_09768 [Tieghemostelium lacteum]